MHGHFKRSNFHDNGTRVDEFGCIISNSRYVKGQSPQGSPQLNGSSDNHSLSPGNSLRPTRLRNTNIKYENSKNQYGTFLNDRSELPRLSILDNYKQIIRIMNNSYIKGNEYRNKFKNRMEKDIVNDEEY